MPAEAPQSSLDILNNDDVRGGAFQTLATKVYQTLREEIVSGQLEPETRLVRRAISKRLGVSPIPVLEALHRLESDGLVESEPMYGSRVKAWTLETVRNDQVLREALECQAARLCAENATPAHLEELTHAAVNLDDTVSRPDAEAFEGMHQHLDFHLRIARFGGFASIERELRRLWQRRLMRLNWLNARMFPVPEDWHQALVAAIASRDADRAEAQARRHVTYGQEHDLQVLEAASKRKPEGERG